MLKQSGAGLLSAWLGDLLEAHCTPPRSPLWKKGRGINVRNQTIPFLTIMANRNRKKAQVSMVGFAR